MRLVHDRNVLDAFCLDFCRVLERHAKYIIVSGFLAISSGRTRGTEDIDVILERLDEEKFKRLDKDLVKSGFECIQGEKPEFLYRQYLAENLSLRYVRRGHLLPEMEVKLAKDLLDEHQLENRAKLPLTGVDVWFGDVNINIAFKEELLKSEKDLEDARHLRAIFSDQVDEKKINGAKHLIHQWRLKT